VRAGSSHQSSKKSLKNIRIEVVTTKLSKNKTVFDCRLGSFFLGRLLVRQIFSHEKFATLPTVSSKKSLARAETRHSITSSIRVNTQSKKFSFFLKLFLQPLEK